MLMTEIEVTEIEVPREKKYAKTRQCIKLEKDAPPSMYPGLHYERKAINARLHAV
jgi:hypothetical protein